MDQSFVRLVTYVGAAIIALGALVGACVSLAEEDTERTRIKACQTIEDGRERSACLQGNK